MFLIKLVHRWRVLHQTVQDGRKGGTRTPKHILRATGQEEDPGVSHRDSHLLALGVARSQSSAACRQQPHDYNLAGMVRGAPQAQSRTEPGSRTDERGRWERGGDNNRKRFGEILGQKWKTFILFPSSPMWKRHSARRKTGVDGTQRQKDRQASYPPPDLKEKWKRRLIADRKTDTLCSIWRCLRNGRSHSALQF